MQLEHSKQSKARDGCRGHDQHLLGALPEAVSITDPLIIVQDIFDTRTIHPSLAGAIHFCMVGNQVT